MRFAHFARVVISVRRKHNLVALVVIRPLKEGLVVLACAADSSNPRLLFRLIQRVEGQFSPTGKRPLACRVKLNFLFRFLHGGSSHSCSKLVQT